MGGVDSGQRGMCKSFPLECGKAVLKKRIRMGSYIEINKTTNSIQYRSGTTETLCTFRRVKVHARASA